MIGIVAGAIAGLGIWLVVDTFGPAKIARYAAVLVTAGLVGLVCISVTGVPVLAALTVVAVLGLVVAAPGRRRRKALQARTDAWPDAIDIIRASVRTGATLPEALASPAAAGPECLRPLFGRYRDELVVTGSFDRALPLLATDEVGARIVTIMAVSATVGSADIGRVLDSLSQFLRADKANNAQIMARQSWNVAAARIAVAAPWITVLLMSGRGATRTAYTTAVGSVVLVGVALASALAYSLMVRCGSVVGSLP